MEVRWCCMGPRTRKGQEGTHDRLRVLYVDLYVAKINLVVMWPRKTFKVCRLFQATRTVMGLAGMNILGLKHRDGGFHRMERLSLWKKGNHNQVGKKAWGRLASN